MSCVNGNGDCFLDDYVKPITDDSSAQYSQGWSTASNFVNEEHLTSFKTIHMKLLYLIDQGVNFISHGENHVLRTLSISVRVIHFFYLYIFLNTIQINLNTDIELHTFIHS